MSRIMNIRMLHFVWVILFFWSDSIASAQSLTSTSTYALSFQNQRKMVRAASGTLAMVYQKGSPATAGGGLVLAISRDNGQNWPETLSLVAVNNTFADVMMAPNNDIYVVHSKNGDSVSAGADVGFLKLQYQPLSDNWRVERSSVVYDANASTAGYNGVVMRDGASLWAAYRYRSGSEFSIVVKHSPDNGFTWNDAITADLPGPDADETAVFAHFGNRLALIYYHQNLDFKWRWRFDNDAPNLWQPSELIYHVTSALPSKSAYSVVVDNQERIHLVFNSNGIRHTQFDGILWQNPIVLADQLGTYPSLLTDGNRLWAVWERSVGSSQDQIESKEYHPETASWDLLPRRLSDPSEAIPSAAWCYSAFYNSLSNVTTAAGNTKSGDVKHAVTTKMIQDYDDAVYIGQPMPFDYLRAQLSVGGIGGAVTWEYWNGTVWVSFAPQSGAYNFAKSGSVQLWPNVATAPVDWQAASVGGSDFLYYVRARVTTPFSTPPVGTQLTSVKQNRTPTTLARDLSFNVLAWHQGMAAPYAIVVKQPAP